MHDMKILAEGEGRGEECLFKWMNRLGLHYKYIELEFNQNSIA